MQCDLVWTHWLVFLVTTNSEHVIKYLHEFLKSQSSFILVHSRPISHTLKKLCNHESNKSLIPLHDYNFKLISWINFVECNNVLIPLGLVEGDYFTMFSTYLLWFSWVHLSLLNLNFGWQVSSSHCFFFIAHNSMFICTFAMKHILTIDVVCFV
jgi:hypothetical protein